jgi:arylsulfatase A
MEETSRIRKPFEDKEEIAYLKREDMKKIILLLTSSFAITGLNAREDSKLADSTKPNIVLIYTDDLGFGDLSVNGATGVKTPHVDRLAKEGLNFTDAHCSAATCTPSRVALLTGEYAFRS